MYRKSAFFLFTAGALTFLCSMAFEKNADAWWYVRGEPYYWYYQDDVYAFRTNNGQQWTEALDTNFVKYAFHRDASRDQMNIVYFKPCSEEERNSVKDIIRGSEGFGHEFSVISLYPDKPYSTAEWFVVDDLLLVNFNSDSLTEKRFEQFKQHYALEQINFPDSVFPAGIFTYVFRFNLNESPDAIELAKTIYQQESGLVINVQPNLISAYEEVPGEDIETGVESVALNEITYHLIHDKNQKVKVVVKHRESLTLTMVRVYDLFGREVHAVQIDEMEFAIDIDISDYASGIYFASIENERGEVMGVEKFVKL